MSQAPLTENVLARFGASAERVVRRFMPDPFGLVLLLTLAALAGGLATMGPVAGPNGASWLAKSSSLVKEWTDGFGNPEILKFGLQMVLIVVTGEALCASRPVQRVLAKLVTLPKTAAQGLVLVTVFAMVAGWLHWGFGLVAGALVAREVGRSLTLRGIRVHYALLGTGAYASMLIWQSGLTASAPLLMNTEKNFVNEVLGVSGPAARVPLRETIFTGYNLVASLALFVLVPLVIRAMHPAEPVPPNLDELPELTTSPLRATQAAGTTGPRTTAEWLDSTRLLSFATGAIGLSFLVRYLREHGFDLNHNVVNVTFLMLGLVLHDSPVAYARALTASMRGTAGIVLQFPFYGGLLQLMKFSGLSSLLTSAFIYVATPKTLPLLTFVAATLTKSFVPSGAGEWAVEGPPMLRAAQQLGVPFGKITMAVAYGNMLGNMYQPFWSLPLLGLMGLRARDIMGYCLVLLVVSFPVLALALWLG